MKTLAVISQGNNSVQLYEKYCYRLKYRGLVAGKISCIESHNSNELRLSVRTSKGISYLYVDLIQKARDFRDEELRNENS